MTNLLKYFNNKWHLPGFDATDFSLERLTSKCGNLRNYPKILIFYPGFRDWATNRMKESMQSQEKLSTPLLLPLDVRV